MESQHLLELLQGLQRLAGSGSGQSDGSQGLLPGPDDPPASSAKKGGTVILGGSDARGFLEGSDDDRGHKLFS